MKPSLGNVEINLPVLLESRMLVQANSGAGKSWTLRRILEQTAAGVQQLLIDPEGEFASLREKFDYIVCAPHDADAVANPHTAAALARALWESGSSAILDIYELKAHERILFVRRFLEALINAPKKVWHPTLVGIDEIQMFAPQQGSAESLAAVIDLASRGRKRGLALVGATQRLSKLHKDVAAELLNTIVMRTGLDVAVQRAADELGLARASAAQTLRELEPGEAFVFGPALTRGVERTRIGPVATSHPKTGQRGVVAPPPPSKAILAKLAKIEGLQRDAEKEAKTLESLQAEVTDLRRRLTIAEKRPATAAPAAANEAVSALREELAYVTRKRDGLQLVLNGWHDRARKIAKALLEGVGDVAMGTKAPAQLAKAIVREEVRRVAREDMRAPGPVSDGITGPQQRIIDALAWLAAFGVEKPTRECLGARAGVVASSGSFRNNLGALRTAGLIDYPGNGLVCLSDAGRDKANAPQDTPTLQALHDAWLGLVANPQAAILRELIGAHPASLSRSELGSRLGVIESSGSFRNNLGRLRTLGAIDYPAQGEVKAADILFPEGVRRG